MNPTKLLAQSFALLAVGIAWVLMQMGLGVLSFAKWVIEDGVIEGRKI